MASVLKHLERAEEGLKLIEGLDATELISVSLPSFGVDVEVSPESLVVPLRAVVSRLREDVAVEERRTMEFIRSYVDDVLGRMSE